MMTAKAIDVAQKYLDFLDSEKPAPSSRWLNLVNLLESFAAEARNEALEEAAKSLPTNWVDEIFHRKPKVELPWNCPEIEWYTQRLCERIRALKSKPESGGKVK